MLTPVWAPASCSVALKSLQIFSASPVHVAMFGCGISRWQFVGGLLLKLLQESASSVEIGVGRGYGGTAVIDVVQDARARERPSGTEKNSLRLLEVKGRKSAACIRIDMLYMYRHTYIHTHTYINIVNACTHTHAQAHTHTYVIYIYVCVCRYVYTYILCIPK